MKSLLPFICLLFTVYVQGQSYQQLTDSAWTIMRQATDSATRQAMQQKALDLYEKAFSRFPREKDGVSLYKAGYLAGVLEKKEAAFNYLEQAVDKQEWGIVLGRYANNEFANLVHDERWKQLLQKATHNKTAFIRALLQYQQGLEKQAMDKRIPINATDNGQAIYQKIRAYNQFPAIGKQAVSMSLPLHDSVTTPYLVYLPLHYNPKQSYPLLFFLHGGVRNTTSFPDYTDASWGEGWNRFYTQYATANNVIMVYPNGNRRYNWMTPDSGFFMVPEILRRVKQLFNVDDNRIFISGHSNGASGSFAYLLKQPAPFAGFFGFNTKPKVFTGGTFIRNILNRSFMNVSTDEDYYFPPAANDTLSALMRRIGADYQDYRFNGFPHWFPAFDTSEGAYKTIFHRVTTTQRNPLATELYWECDDTRYGTCDWLQITGLDTTGHRAPWHDSLNFTIHEWKNYNDKDSLITLDTLAYAFSFPRRSGAVKAQYANNIFSLETSQVKSLRIRISPDMVDITRPVIVRVNGKEAFKGKVQYNKAFILDHFNATADRKTIWIDKVDVVVR
ncbi:hypothetical protein HB364_14305 [Pseudoflavitalea sp. X16]|uniref:alpha/beta hydrolase-fold protein n=1 Tax=Paraflavitalea devenefica TaxID=2716334 RepID=UPI00141FC209|nr:alpha/beta hydrolase-fold protein [Paraflavitalea devenefica]NII26260.1 hypothetical protein [Paraflavitalea devenefica]